MKTTKMNQRSYKVTADEGMWLTLYTDEMDIRLYNSSKTIYTTSSGVAAIREITDEENQEYMDRRDIAIQAIKVE